jgi:phage baseplate assembly protein W
MAKFKGFTTINGCKKFSLNDRELIIRDLLNSFLIREGQIPGRPDFGTRLWGFIFEPGTEGLLRQITAECKRVIDYDPRIQLLDVGANRVENAVEVLLNVVIDESVGPEVLTLKFDEEQGTANLV